MLVRIHDNWFIDHESVVQIYYSQNGVLIIILKENIDKKWEGHECRPLLEIVEEINSLKRQKCVRPNSEYHSKLE